MNQAVYGEQYEGKVAASAYPEARGLTYNEAIAQAKAWMCSQSPLWCAASDASIAEYICTGQTLLNGVLQTGGCTLYTGSDPVRLAICGSSQCPVTPPPPPGGGDLLMPILLVGGLAMVGVLAFTIAQSGKKKILIQKLE